MANVRQTMQDLGHYNPEVFFSFGSKSILLLYVEDHDVLTLKLSLSNISVLTILINFT